MFKYNTFELSFKGEEPKGSQVNVDLEATFTNGEVSKTVKGFYAGNGTYKVRFLPEIEGLYKWEVKGIVEGSGEEVCFTSSKLHGMVKTQDNHFIYQDGTKYLPFGTTVYALANQDDDLIAETLESLKNSPFNKVRHCVFPKYYDYNLDDPKLYAFEKNEAGKWDVNKPVFEFWDHFESVMEKLSETGIETDLILFHPYDKWGFARFTLEECLVYLDYAMRRFSAIPHIWWSLANEYDLVFTRTMEDWFAIEEFIAKEDIYGHLLSNHNCFEFYDFSRKNITHCSIQTIQMYKADAWQEEFKKPVVYDECCYEGDLSHDWGNISGFEMVNRFWCACAKGAYVTHGETLLNDEEIIWWSRGGKLVGESPSRIGFLRDILYSLPGPLDNWSHSRFEDFGPVDDNALLSNFDDFVKKLESLSEIDKELMAIKSSEYMGRVGDEAFLKYFARGCTSRANIGLPEDKKYKVEVIDVWNMTKEVVMEEVSGKITVKLPGKEGMAILATRI